MKATGFIKKVDEMGRIVVPKDIRKALGISNLDYVQFYLDENGVVLRKYDNCCFLCSSREDVSRTMRRSPSFTSSPSLTRTSEIFTPLTVEVTSLEVIGATVPVKL